MLAHDLVLPNLIAKRAAEFPDRVFMQQVTGGEMTYRQLRDKALRRKLKMRSERARACAASAMAVTLPAVRR